MRAIGIIASNSDGTPAVTTTLPAWVHLLPSLSGSFQSYKVAALVTPAVTAALANNGGRTGASAS